MQEALMASLFASLLYLLGATKAPSAERRVDDVYPHLRQQVFSIKPADIGVSAQPGNRVWGIVMETGYPDGVATVVALSDGTVSLYFSGGGGMIGLGEHDGPRRAAKELISSSPRYLDQAARTTTFPLPKVGQTRFFFLTFDGVFTVEAKEEDLGRGRLSLSPLFYEAQDVITEARLVDEQRRKQSR
jgi:hypothetical protein